MNFSITEIKEIISTVSVYDNMDYSGYSISFMKRRLSEIFEEFNIKRIHHFYEQLKNENVRDKVIGEMFVETTEMFRDPAFWRVVRDNIIPKLPQNTTFWFPNETTGEETFSLSIILKEQKLKDKFKIICNNPSKFRCNTIQSGNIKIKNFDINHSNYKRLENIDLFETYFLKESTTHIISQEIRNIIKCKQVAYEKAVENEKISMIFVRNQTLYYDPVLTEHFFQTLYEKLMPGGYLAVGIKEKIPDSLADKMTVVSESEKIYLK